MGKTFASCKCGCSLKCWENIDNERQEEIFQSFYENSNATQKTLFLRSVVAMTPIGNAKEKFFPLPKLKNKQFKCAYKFMDKKGVAQQVCRDFATNVLQVPPGRLYRAAKSAGSNPSAMEKRGKATPKNKTSEEARVGVKNFIQLFPKYQSHYGRAKSQKQYLSPGLDLETMYKMYTESCTLKEREPVSNYMFRDIFKKEFNLSFKRRHTDTCKTCDRLAVSLKDESSSAETITKLKEEQTAHHKLCERIKAVWEHDIEEAQDDNTVAVLTFDLQKALATPTLTTNIAYYKRQLWTYNLCVYDEVQKKGNYTRFVLHTSMLNIGKKFTVQTGKFFRIKLLVHEEKF